MYSWTSHLLQVLLWQVINNSLSRAVYMSTPRVDPICACCWHIWQPVTLFTGKLSLFRVSQGQLEAPDPFQRTGIISIFSRQMLVFKFVLNVVLTWWVRSFEKSVVWYASELFAVQRLASAVSLNFPPGTMQLPQWEKFTTMREQPVPWLRFPVSRYTAPECLSDQLLKKYHDEHLELSLKHWAIT